MPWGFSFFKQTANANLKPGEDIQTTNEVSYRPNDGWGVSSETELNLVNIGAEVRQETIKFDAGNEDASLTLAGPSAGVELGFKSNQNKTGFSAMAELSAARAEGTLNVTENAALYATANLNANTGAKIGTDGVEVNVVGFGATLGVGGKWTINTPFGSLGGCSPSAITVSNEVRNTNTNTNRNRNTNEQIYAN